MKVLEPRTIQEYRCDFCNKKYISKYACSVHEDKCYKNINRNCPMCKNTGCNEINYDGRKIGICQFCITAKTLGGKSYIASQQPNHT